jgi:hypothetical protein
MYLRRPGKDTIDSKGEKCSSAHVLRESVLTIVLESTGDFGNDETMLNTGFVHASHLGLLEFLSPPFFS